MPHPTFRTILIAAVFLTMIAFPILNELLGFIPDIPGKENRALAEKPTTNLQHLDPFPRQYESYYNDHFTLRYRGMELYSNIQYHLFQKSPIPDQAFIGKDGWYFFAGKEQWSYLGQGILTPQELDTIQSELEYRAQWLRNQGTQFYICIAPSKNNIYSEYMPTTVYPLWDSSWGEQMLAYLNKHSHLKTINLYQTLRTHRKENLLYYKEDNHWTSLGAYYAANEILKRIQQDFPAVAMNNNNDFHLRMTAHQTGNITNMFGLTDLAQDSVAEMVPYAGFRAKPGHPTAYKSPEGFPYPSDFAHVREIPDTTKPTMVLISDSFGEAIYPFLAEQFRRSLRLFDGWQYKLNPEIIQAEQPDIVILLPFESNIRHLLQNRAGNP